MRYLTDRKRAEGKGASGTGTEHHWYMQVSSVGLALVVPILVYVIGSTLGSDRETVLEVFSNPVIAILTGLGLFVGMAHFRKGAQMMIEDYWKKSTKKVLIISVIVLSYGLTAFGLFALAKIAL